MTFTQHLAAAFTVCSSCRRELLKHAVNFSTCIKRQRFLDVSIEADFDALLNQFAKLPIRITS